jgi:hypothetical protein
MLSLGPGTAILVDSQGAIRARCRCGNPLQDPIISPAERCDGCPPNSRLPSSWRLAPSYYFFLPKRSRTGGRITLRVVKVLGGSYVIEESVIDGGKTNLRTITVPKQPTQTVSTTRTHTTTHETTVAAPSRTVFIPRMTTITSTRVLPGKTVTVPVYTGGG